MADPMLTAEELDELERLDIAARAEEAEELAHPDEDWTTQERCNWSRAWEDAAPRLIAQARRALDVEAEIAKLKTVLERIDESIDDLLCDADTVRTFVANEEEDVRVVRADELRRIHGRVESLIIRARGKETG